MNRVPQHQAAVCVTNAARQRAEPKRAGLGTDWLATLPLQETSLFFLSLAVASGPLDNVGGGDGGPGTASC